MSDVGVKLVDSMLSNSNVALKMMMQYLNTPTVAGVMIFCESIEKQKDTEISEQVILDAEGGRTAKSDNFTVRPKTWIIKGYIKPFAYEMTSHFQPSIYLQLQQLEDAVDTRNTVEFKDKRNKRFQVGIESLKPVEEAGTENALKIEMILKETTKLTVETALVDKVQSAGTDTEKEKELGTQTSTNIFGNDSIDSDLTNMTGVGEVGPP
jgi:hypothetical protein